MKTDKFSRRDWSYLLADDFIQGKFFEIMAHHNLVKMAVISSNTRKKANKFLGHDSRLSFRKYHENVSNQQFKDIQRLFRPWNLIAELSNKQIRDWEKRITTLLKIGLYSAKPGDILMRM